MDDNYKTFPTGGATDSNPTGSGDIDDTVNLPPDSSITYTVTETTSCSVESGSVLDQHRHPHPAVGADPLGYRHRHDRPRRVLTGEERD